MADEEAEFLTHEQQREAQMHQKAAETAAAQATEDIGEVPDTTAEEVAAEVKQDTVADPTK